MLLTNFDTFMLLFVAYPENCSAALLPDYAEFGSMFYWVQIKRRAGTLSC